LTWWFVLPAIADQREAARIIQLRQDAETALNSGDYDRAVSAFNDLLEMLPDDPAALSGLEQARNLRRIISLYSDAISFMEAHRWEEALSKLQQIEAEQPGYGDITNRMNFIRLQQDLTKRFNEAEAAFDRDDYDVAIEKYENLQSSDSGFQHDVVVDHLFLSYLQSGLAKKEAAGSNPQQLQEALNILDKALVLRPNDSQVRGEVQLLRLYLSGSDDFEDENWAQAVSNFTPVYEARSDFADDTVSQLLYDAYVAWGDDFFSEEGYEQALVRYEEASQIEGVDTSKAEEKIALVEETVATPTPTPEPTPILAEVPEVTPTDIIIVVDTFPASTPIPVPTPEPFPFVLQTMNLRTNCNGNGYIHGVVWDLNYTPVASITVRAFNTTSGIGPVDSLPTSAGGIYQIILNEKQIAGMWTVHILDENEQPASLVWGQELGVNCTSSPQELKVDWRSTIPIQSTASSQ
jgi:tetratricopeptide (TPR) repeat protein